jgi:NAD(P)H-dependent FMN reductase
MANRREPSETPEVANYMQGKIKRVASIKTIYVQDTDQWELAKAYAVARGLSMSELLMAGVDKLINESCPVCARISQVLNTAYNEKIEVKAESKVKAARAKVAETK